MEKKSVCSERGVTCYWVSKLSPDATTAVVFCHGLSADHTLFDKQLDHWCAVASVITWDIPLHGESRPYEDFTLDHAAEELKRILDQEGLTRVILAGQAAGGYVAQAFVRAYPAMVAAFIGIDTTPFGKDYYSKSDLFWIRRYTDIARLYPYGYYCRVASRSATCTEEAEASFRDSLHRLGRQGMIAAAHSVYTDFLRNEDPVVFSCPVLLVMGEHDKTGLVRRYNQQWAERCGFPLQIIDDAAHNSNYDNYSLFNQAMHRFLEKNGLLP